MKQDSSFSSLSSYDPISLSAESTVVAEYSKDTKRSVAYQSEADLEKAFIELLKNQSYEYLSITSEIDLMANFKTQLENLNKTKFSDSEWELFFRSNIAGEKDGVIDKTRRIQEDHVQVLRRDSGEFKNIYLIDKHNIHNNKLQVKEEIDIQPLNDEIRGIVSRQQELRQEIDAFVADFEAR